MHSIKMVLGLDSYASHEILITKNRTLEQAYKDSWFLEVDYGSLHIRKTLRYTQIHQVSFRPAIRD
jgi:hypothetical protein